MTGEYLVESGFITKGGLAILRDLVAKRANIVVSGAIGSGKTTLVKALLEQVEGKALVWSKKDEYPSSELDVETLEVDEDLWIQSQRKDIDVIVIDDIGGY